VDSIDWIFRYIIQEEELKDRLAKGLVPETDIKRTEYHIEFLKAVKELQISLLDDIPEK
jgi:hypothetical protein